VPKQKKQSPKQDANRQWTANAREALSPVTLGIAHDLNNLLTGVFSIADLCLHDGVPDDPLRERIEMIRRNGQSAAHLIQRLFHEHSATAGHEEYHDLQQLLGANLDLIRWAVPKSIEVSQVLSSQSEPVWLDGIQFRTVCLQLALHAASLIKGRGSIILETDLEAQRGKAKSSKGGRGEKVILKITHSGSNSAEKKSGKKRGPAAKQATPPAFELARTFAESYGGDFSVGSDDSGSAILILRLPKADIE